MTALQRRLARHSIPLLAAALCVLSAPSALHAKANSDPVATRSSSARAGTPALATPRAGTPVVTVRGTGAGQAGYVHYFVITDPDGETETQVGLELPGGRIAWSFPNASVTIAPFMAQGEVVAGETTYQVRHLYGIRPFPDAKSMADLRSALESRVNWWVERNTPYCDEENPTHDLCVSCLGFVLRVLYPGESPETFVLPRDFSGTRTEAYTTEDFLMYLAGVRLDAPRQARSARIRALKIPAAMRQELMRISGALPATIASASAPAKPRTRAVAQSPKRSAAGRGS